MKQGEFFGPNFLSSALLILILFFSSFSVTWLLSISQKLPWYVSVLSSLFLFSNQFLLASFFILVYVYSLVHCSGKSMLSFSKPPAASFFVSLLMCLLAGSNHSVDRWYPSVAWSDSGCDSDGMLIPASILMIEATRRHFVQILYRLNTEWQAVYNWYYR